LDVFRGRQDVRGGLLGRLDDLVELFRRAAELLVELLRRAELGDLVPRAGDRLAHLHELGQHRGEARLALRPEHGGFQPGDGIEHQLRLGRPVPPHVLGEEPAAERRIA